MKRIIIGLVLQSILMLLSVPVLAWTIKSDCVGPDRLSFDEIPRDCVYVREYVTKTQKYSPLWRVLHLRFFRGTLAVGTAAGSKVYTVKHEWSSPAMVADVFLLFYATRSRTVQFFFPGAKKGGQVLDEARTNNQAIWR